MPGQGHAVAIHERHKRLLDDRVTFEFVGAESRLGAWESTLPETHVQERIARWVQHLQRAERHRLGHSLHTPFCLDEMALPFDLPGEVCLHPADRHTYGLGEVVHVVIGGRIFMPGVCENSAEVWYPPALAQLAGWPYCLCRRSS